MKFSEINTNTTEGQLLLGAVALITTSPGFTDKTPDEVMQLIQERVECFNEDCEGCAVCDMYDDRLLSKATQHRILDILSRHVGETGESESAVGTMERLLDELKSYRQQAK